MKAITVLVITGLWMSTDVRAQTAATWSFAGSSVAASSTGADITATAVTMGSDVTGGGQFSGSDFFGQDGWPATTTIDPNAYMQFSVSPNSGYYLALNTVVLNLRHSTLGTAAGSGPTSWQLRSSVDGYTSVLGSGTLTTSYQSFTITLPAAFPGIMGTVTFRLYGYNEVMTSGGSNRFVTNSISVKGSAKPGTLAAQSVDLSAVARAQAIDLHWQTQGFADGTSFLLQRADDGRQFTTLETVTGTTATDNTVTAGQWYYRIEAQSPDGSSYFSPVVTVMVSGASATMSIIKGVAAEGSSVRTFLHLPDAGRYWLNIRTMDGQPVYRTEMSGPGGDITTDIALGSRAHGVYILTLTGNGANSSREFFY
ncbi:MAG TPA: hypothetical protein VGS79_12245 [Puia sp.]|nr:hypothetical protein [Puia sp.]